MKKIKEIKLNNGLQVIFEDLSKVITGDRWLLRLRCAAEIGLQNWMLDKLSEQSELNEYVLQQLQGKLTYELVKESQFVDQEVKEQSMTELEQRFQELLMFLEKEEFIEKLFGIRVAELEKQYILQKNCNNNDLTEDEDEPPDFSACFR